MKNYRNPDEKIVFSGRMQRVYDDILLRLKPNRAREMTHVSTLEPEGNPFLDVFREMPDAPYVIALANGIVRSWEATPRLIFPCEAIVGVTRPWYPIREHFSWGLKDVDSLFEDPSLTKKDAAAIAARMEPLNKAYMIKAGNEIFGEKAYSLLRKENAFSAGGYQGHTIPNYDRLLTLGLDGVLELIDECEKKNGRMDDETKNFYEACRIIVRGMSEWLEDYSVEAENLAAQETDKKQRTYYQQISANCAFVAHKKPETLYQAAQLMWCLCIWDWADCLGRVDQYLFPFYEKAVQDEDALPAEEVITALIFKTWENGIHNITLAGVKPETGEDASSDLTYLILQIVRRIHDTHPRLSIRVHDGTPKALLDLAVKMWSEGMSDPTVVSDDNVIRGLTRIGIPLKAARNYSMLGCQEVEIPGESNTGCEDGKFNLAKILEYALYGGKSTTDPTVQIGLKTPEFTECRSFEEFYQIYMDQVKFFTKHFCALCDRGQEVRAANFAKLVKTPFTVGCLEKGKPHDAGGPLYNYGVVETAGLGPVADSLTAIRKLVFEEKKISRQTLLNALKANFTGYERERQMLLKDAPKFGNDDSEADAMAVRVLDMFWSECGKYKSIRGDVYVGACSLLESGISYGKAVGALPDGRFAGEPLGNSIGPRPGADTCGLSAMLSSVEKLPLEKGVGGTTLNVLLPTRLLSDLQRRQSISALMRSYLKNGGQMAQITTANRDELLEAQKYPERYGNLIVRIGGFSIQFVQLEKEAQNEIISRFGAA